MIQLIHVNKIYNPGKENEVHALQDVDFVVNPGDMISVTGPSGSGKSTLLHILGGLDLPTSGQYLFQGEDVGKMKDARRCHLRNRDVAIVLQSYGLLGTETVLRNVALPHIIGHCPVRKAMQKAREALRLVGLAGLEKKPANQLSGGQSQRVAIARAVSMNAKIILADEPTGALDTENTKSLMELLTTLNQQGIAMVIATHNPIVAEQCPLRYHITDGILTRI